MADILVVEDESVIRSALKRLLERHKFRVFEAASVKEAEEHFQLDRFCLIISDLRLPGAPGTELSYPVCTALRESSASCANAARNALLEAAMPRARPAMASMA